MLAAWSRGDVKAIARTFNHDLAASPELAQALIKQPQPELDQMDRAADGIARIGPDRRRRGPPRRQGFGCRDAEKARLSGAPGAIGRRSRSIRR